MKKLMTGDEAVARGLYEAGFYRSTVAIARVLLALALVLSVASTTTPTQLADGFSVLLLPLRLIRVDVDGLSIVLSIALRAIPLTLEELDRIRAAQRARGFNFESGGIVERIKKWFIQVILPNFPHLPTPQSKIALIFCFTAPPL